MLEIQHIPGDYRWEFTVVSIGSTICNRFVFEFFEENELLWILYVVFIF